MLKDCLKMFAKFIRFGTHSRFYRRNLRTFPPNLLAKKQFTTFFAFMVYSFVTDRQIEIQDTGSLRLLAGQHNTLPEV